MQETIRQELKASIETKQEVLNTLVPTIAKAAEVMIAALKAGNKVMFFGNGGSAADAQHLAAEMVGRFLQERHALAGIALTTDSSVLTSLANDYGFETIFERQIEGLAKAGDVAFGLSTSGNSLNVIRGLKKAKELGCKTIGLVGGGKITSLVDVPIAVLGKSTPRIQEEHITIGHILCELIEQALFGEE